MNINSVKPQADLNKNAFDRSRRDVYSIKPAMLVPSFVEDTIPESEYNISDLSILRTQPIQSAPFARMTRHTEYYYVPYSQLFRDFEKIYYERGESQRNVGNVLNVGNSTTIPTVDYSSLVSTLFNEYFFLQFKLLAYADIDYSQEKIDLDYVYSLLPSLPNRIHHNLIDVHGRLCVEDSLRIFDMLGYGNLLPIFKFLWMRVYTYHKNDIDLKVTEFHTFATSANRPTSSTVDNFFANLLQDFETQWKDGLDFQRYDGRRVSVLHLAAYLKVWSDMYRNSQYDVDTNYAYYFNFDYAVSDDLARIPIAKVLQMLIPRYRQWKKDIYTGTFPTAQFGSVAAADLNNPSTIISNASTIANTQQLGVSTNYSGTRGAVVVRDSSGNLVANGGSFTINSSVSALAIRQAMAFQRYKETILRAGNRTPALQRAVFGDNSRYLEDNYVDFLGAWSSSIDFNNVAATAESSSQNVGQLSSNGVSVNSKNHIKFHSHDFGIIIGMTYILPEAEYNAYMLDPQVRKSESFDFYKPDFMNLGMSEIFDFDLNFLGIGENDNDIVLGYLPRYWEYKCSVDKVHGEFYSGLPFELTYFNGSAHPDMPFNSISVGAFSQFVTPRFILPEALTLSRLYCSPDCVDNIFYESSNEQQITDKFLLSDYHEVKCLLPMSVLGLPK